MLNDRDSSSDSGEEYHVSDITGILKFYFYNRLYS
jgi:hypothetical protein